MARSSLVSTVVIQYQDTDDSDASSALSAHSKTSMTTSIGRVHDHHVADH